MKKNMGKVDRVVRVLIASIIAVLYFTGALSGILGIVLMLVAAVLLLTSVVGYCPLYAPFGLRTCPHK